MFSCCLLAVLAKCSAVRTFCSVCSRTTSRASPIQPYTAALGCGEVLGYGLEGVALGLCHLSGGARRLVDVRCGGSHRGTSIVVDSNCLLLCSYHIYVRCKPRDGRPFIFALIHRSAWKGNSRKLAVCLRSRGSLSA